MKDYILNWNQKRILKQIDFLEGYDFYLAGGTSLALHFGHRTSKDLDFYTPHHFESKEIIRQFRKVFSGELTKTIKAKDTLWLKVKQTDLSFFRYPYPLIEKLVPFKSIKLAGPEDVGAMKIEAIIERGTKRDFVDIYYLIKRFGLKEILKFTKKKYLEEFNEPNCLNGLLYFKDADAPQEDRKRIYLYENIEWEDIKEFIQKEVKKYQLAQIRK